MPIPLSITEKSHCASILFDVMCTAGITPGRLVLDGVADQILKEQFQLRRMNRQSWQSFEINDRTAFRYCPFEIL